MHEQTDRLPKFRNPPAVRTSLGLFFRPIDFNATQQAVFWDRSLHREYPSSEVQTPADEDRELFGDERLRRYQVKWRLIDQPPPTQLRVGSASGDRIIKLQQDAIFVEWLRCGPEATYRDYDERKKEIRQRIEELRRFSFEAGLGELSFTSAVVTYTNVLEVPKGCTPADVAAETLVVWKRDSSDGWLPPPDVVNLHFAYPMPDRQGRLHVAVQEETPDKAQALALKVELTARVIPMAAPKPLGDALGWLDVGHEWVVRGFASITDPLMHERWGRLQ